MEELEGREVWECGWVVVEEPKGPCSGERPVGGQREGRRADAGRARRSMIYSHFLQGDFAH